MQEKSLGGFTQQQKYKRFLSKLVALRLDCLRITRSQRNNVWIKPHITS